MNRKISAMRILRSSLIGILLAATACNQSTEPTPVPETETIQVTIGTGPRIDIQTRTELTDGTDIKWESDDRLALWARNSDGSFAFEGAVFSLWRYGTTWEQAFFRGEVPAMDPSGAYRYHAVSPVPASASAETRQATYEIPAVQDGTFHGEWDVMVADAVGSEEAPAPALVEGDNSDAVALAFHHKIHLLRIRIPENRLGEKISQITLNFPVEIAGTMSVDFTDAAAVPTVSGSKSLTLRFDEPKDAGDEVYATIAPVTLSEADAIEIYATGTLYESQHRTIAGKAFAEGHITPIAYNIPEAGETLGTIVRLTLDETGEHTLGERIQSFTLRVEGASFDNGTAERTFSVGESGTYEMLFPQGSNPEELSGKEVTITYDSEHALLTRRFTLPEITPEAVNTVALPGVPYLLSEDFSAVESFDIDTNNTLGNTSSGSNTASTLSQLPANASSSWTGARCGVETGKSLRLCSRNECAALTRGSYHGRLDSPNLEALKGSCRIVVRFNYSMARSSNQGNMLQPYLAAGIADDATRDATSNLWGSFISGEGDPGTILQYNIPAVIYDLDDGGALDGSYDNVTRPAEFTTTATPAHRIVWEAYMQSGEPRETFKYYYSNNWVYIDNITVSIAE